MPATSSPVPPSSEGCFGTESEISENRRVFIGKSSMNGLLMEKSSIIYAYKCISNVRLNGKSQAPKWEGLSGKIILVKAFSTACRATLRSAEDVQNL